MEYPELFLNILDEFDIPYLAVHRGWEEKQTGPDLAQLGSVVAARLTQRSAAPMLTQRTQLTSTAVPSLSSQRAHSSFHITQSQATSPGPEFLFVYLSVQRMRCETHINSQDSLQTLELISYSLTDTRPSVHILQVCSILIHTISEDF